MSSAAIFNENFYLTNNADVVLAISQGNFSSATDHFNQFGGKELRAPNATFNPSYYAVQNTDVLNAVSAGTFSNVFAHYQEFGEIENRGPAVEFAGFTAAAYLEANTDVAAAITAGTIGSALDHFIAFGQNESRTGSGVSETVATGSTFQLTTGTDSGQAFVGTANNDTFNASLVTEGGVANQQTLGALDQLDGGAGSGDTLNFSYTTAVTPLSITNIENIILQDADAATETIDMINVSGMTKLTTVAAGGAVDVNNIAAITDLVIQNQAVNVDIDYVAAAIAGSSDTQNITLTGATDGDVTIDGVETVAITTTGSAANTIDINDTATTLTTVTVAGTANLTLNDTTALEAEVTTVNASGFAGNLTVSATNAAVMTMTGGTGNDSFILGATYIGGTTGATRDTITGGDGTDELNITTARLVAATTNQDTVTGIERIEVSDALNGSYNLGRFSGVTELQLTLGGSANASVGTVAAGTTIDIDADIANQFYTFQVLGVGTSDSLILDLAANVDFLGTTGNTDTFIGVEILNIAGAASGTHVFADGLIMTDTAANQKAVITGAAAVTFSSISTMDELDASAATGVITTTGGFAGGATIAGGTKGDTLIGSTAGDIITGNNGTDTINGLAGADTIVLTETTAAIDTVVIGNGQTSDVVTDFVVGTGGDQVDFDLTALNIAAAIAGNETDTIAFFGAAGAAITDATAGATNAVATISNDSSVHATVLNATVILLDGGATTFATVGDAVDAFEASGSFTITHQSNVADDDTFLFAYENSTTGFVTLAAASFEAADDNNASAAAIADAALKGADLLTISGVTDVTTITAANVDFI
jgi:hypothetical protein